MMGSPPAPMAPRARKLDQIGPFRREPGLLELMVKARKSPALPNRTGETAQNRNHLSPNMKAANGASMSWSSATTCRAIGSDPGKLLKTLAKV